MVVWKKEKQQEAMDVVPAAFVSGGWICGDEWVSEGWSGERGTAAHGGETGVGARDCGGDWGEGEELWADAVRVPGDGD